MEKTNDDKKMIPNIYVQHVRRQERLAVERANNLRKKYKILRDKRIAKKLDLIFKISLTDEDLAKNLQTFYYT
jgi:hypothetical protein